MVANKDLKELRIFIDNSVAGERATLPQRAECIRFAIKWGYKDLVSLKTAALTRLWSVL